MTLQLIIMAVQLFVAIVIGVYFFSLLRNQQTHRSAIERHASQEMEKLKKWRSISLTIPFTESTRPQHLKEIIGQKQGLRMLQAALCCTNPQHVIIYGPPGVGKTAAVRVILEEAKKHPSSPFRVDAKMIEVDATIIRFDERGIADPLIGSVHDPIYQGAGIAGHAGIPQPRYGAVSKAHGGILFIDEIGELHPVQMNKLLKVLEDRKVLLESSYYHPEDKKLPAYIHDLFQNGVPADFRLVGATTRNPHEIPTAIRSRCVEIFFRSLHPEDLACMVEQALHKLHLQVDRDALELLTRYASNGREAMNMMQIAANFVKQQERHSLCIEDIQWVIECTKRSPSLDKKINSTRNAYRQAGFVHGLACYGHQQAVILDIEVVAIPTIHKRGSWNSTGIVEEEEIQHHRNVMRRKSSVKSSIENVMMVLRKAGIELEAFDLHIHFPGGMPVDGPSAGLAIATAIVSAIWKIPVDPTIAITGELSLHGYVKAVGGVPEKIEAAIRAGARKVILPVDNWQPRFSEQFPIELVAVNTLQEIFATFFFSNHIDVGLKSFPIHDISQASSIQTH